MKEIFFDYLKPVLEILIIAFAVYNILFFIRGTRAMQILKGVLLLLAAVFLANLLKLDTINLLLEKIFPVAIIAIIVIFQNELRRALAIIGGNTFFSPYNQHETMLHTIAEAASWIAKKRIGALIAIENEVALRPYIESGVKIDAEVTLALLTTIFHPNTSLHDGGVIIQGNRVAAAGCLFPLSTHRVSYHSSGTRHLAALGLSEESDAVVIVISEETGRISMAFQGKLVQNLDEERLTKALVLRLIRRRQLRLGLRKRKILAK